MKGGITKRLEEVGKALEKNQLKKALSLTEIPKLEQHHSWLVEAGKTCLDNRDKPEICKKAIKEAREKVMGTTQLDIDSTDIEGLEEYLEPPAETPPKQEPAATETPEQSDEDLYAHCADCHVADAVVKFHHVAEQCGDEVVMGRIETQLAEEPAPERWIETMEGIAAEQTCGVDSYREILGEVKDYLRKEGSPILQE